MLWDEDPTARGPHAVVSVSFPSFHSDIIEQLKHLRYTVWRLIHIDEIISHTLLWNNYHKLMHISITSHSFGGFVWGGGVRTMTDSLTKFQVSSHCTVRTLWHTWPVFPSPSPATTTTLPASGTPMWTLSLLFPVFGMPHLSSADPNLSFKVHFESYFIKNILVFH